MNDIVSAFVAILAVAVLLVAVAIGVNAVFGEWQVLIYAVLGLVGFGALMAKVNS